MIVDLTGFFDNSGTARSLEGEIIATDKDLLEYDVSIVNPIKYNGVIYRISDYYTLDLNINFKIKTECDRCLKPLELEVETQLFGKLVNSHVDEQLDEEELEDIIYLDKNRIDLKEYILDQVLSSIPMKSICIDDCKGLCQSCGVDLNVQSCDCDENIIDPRLEKLKELFPDE